MRAIIMAGGEGVRLRPLTQEKPKPLIPLLDEPVAGYVLQLLRRHGIRRATMTLRFRAEQVRQHFGDGSRWGVQLDYAAEDEPLGTAGSVRQAAGGAGETILVMSGDVLTDCDLSAMIAQHRQTGAAATIAVTEAEDTAAYGLCDVTEDGRIAGFVEKPGSGAPRGLVNAGIYLLEPSAMARIPADVPWDFGRDVFPRMAAEGMLRSWRMRGYWRDVGSPAQYAQAQTDLLMGRVGLAVRGRRVGHAILADGARVSDRARVTGRCYVGANAQVGSGAVIGAGAVLCRGARVSGGAHIEHACLWEHVTVGGDAILRNVVVMPRQGNASLVSIAPYPAG